MTFGTHVVALRSGAPTLEPEPEPDAVPAPDPARESDEREDVEKLLRRRPGSDAGRADELRETVWNEPASVESLRVKRPCPTSWTLTEGELAGGELASSRAMLITELSEEVGADTSDGDDSGWMDIGEIRGIWGSGELAMVAKGRL